MHLDLLSFRQVHKTPSQTWNRRRQGCRPTCSRVLCTTQSRLRLRAEIHREEKILFTRAVHGMHCSSVAACQPDLPFSKHQSSSPFLAYHLCLQVERPMACSHIESLMNELFTEAQQRAQDHLSMPSCVDKVVRTGLCAILHVVAAARDINAVRYIGSISDITEREAARTALNEATFRHQWDQITLTIVNLCKSKDLDSVSFE